MLNRHQQIWEGEVVIPLRVRIQVGGRAILHLEEVLRENNICILNVEHLEIHGRLYRIIDISGGSISAQLPRCFEEERFMLLEDEV